MNPLLRWLTRMPSTHQVIFLAILGGLIVGNFAPDSRVYYPFVHWDIFGYLHF